MRRDEFLSELRRALGRMSDQEKRDVMYDYEEHFRMGMAEGKSEEEIARSLGNPRLIGKSFQIDALLEEPKDGGAVGAGSVLRALFASISLTFFNVIFILGPFFGLVGAMIGLWAGAVSIFVAGAAAVLWSVVAEFLPNYFLNFGIHPAVLFFGGVGVAGLGVLSVIGMWQLSLLFVKATAAYVRFNARIVTRRK